jgi:hypothetical protein
MDNVRIEATQVEMAPTIYRTTDAIKADKLITINGEALTSTSVVYINTANGVPSETPPVGSTQLTIQQTDRDGQFIVAQFPSNAAPRVYNLWVKNSYGYSKAYKVNAPRPLFISEKEAFNGESIEISGRNLDATVYGASSQITQVRLVNVSSGSTYTITPTDVNPYYIKFPVGTTPQATYWVEARNDANDNWVRLQSGQQLKIVSSGSDPLGLGVVWAKNFNWTNEYNVTSAPYNAIPNDGLNDSVAIQNAINAAATAGGGVVYIPDGIYNIAAKLELKERVVLKGQSTTNTILKCGAGIGNMIASHATATYGKYGVANLTLTMLNTADGNYRPDIYINIGSAGYNNVDLRTATEIFVKNVKIVDSLATSQVTGRRGMGAYIVAKDRVIFDNNNFIGIATTLSRVYVNEYVSIRNNSFEYATDATVSTAAYTFMMDNTLTGHYEKNMDLHGLFGRENVHMANNSVSGMGCDAYNDGEALGVEVPGMEYTYGTVVSCEGVTLKLSRVDAWPINPRRSGYYNVIIIDGKGVGQYRKVKKVDQTNDIVTLEIPWDVEPDTTSKFVYTTPNNNVTFYDNIIMNNKKGIYFYGNVIDGVAANNTSTDSEGIFISAVYKSGDYVRLNFYVSMVNNTLTGITRVGNHAGIGYGASRAVSPGNYYSMTAYGMDIRGNSITGNKSVIPTAETECPTTSGIFLDAASYSSFYDGQNVAGDGTNTIIENNILNTLNVGITATRCNYGQVLNGNSFTNVTTNTSTSLSQNTVLLP